MRNTIEATPLEEQIIEAAHVLASAINIKEMAMRAEAECTKATVISKITTTHELGPEFQAIKRARYDLELLIRQL